MSVAKKLNWLRTANFGHADAENEQGRFKDFFVETKAYDRLINGDVTVVHGRKGSGKSALYGALVQRGQNVLRERNIYVVHGNHLDLIDQLPQALPEGFNWQDFWFSYILILSAGRILQENWQVCPEIIGYLQAKRLLDNNPNSGLFLARLSQFVWDMRGGLSYEEVFRRSLVASDMFVGQHLSDTTISRSTHITSRPIGTANEITVSWSNLLQHVHSALAKLGVTFWIALDKLDVVFSRLPQVEVEAINGLLRCREDMNSFQHIRLKLFLQSHAFRKAKDLGLANADHLVTSTQELIWDEVHLTRMLIHRLLSNAGVREFMAEPTLGRNNLLGHFSPDKLPAHVIAHTLKSPTTRKHVLRSIFEGVELKAAKVSQREFSQQKDAEFEAVDSNVLSQDIAGDSSFIGKVMQLLSNDTDEHNPRDYVNFLHFAVENELTFLEAGKHGRLDFLISRHAADQAMNRIAEEKISTLISRYNLMTGARLQPYIRELKKLVSRGAHTARVVELLGDWTKLAGGYEHVARETLKYCYENNMFKKTHSVEDELLRAAGRSQPTLVLTPLAKLGLQALKDRDLSE